MKAAIEMIKDASQTRQTQDGRSAYMVSHVLMAMGQLNANWIYEDAEGHSEVFETAENIAGHHSTTDAVDAWYDDEKNAL